MIDRIDSHLLGLLQDDCTQSLFDLGKRVGLSVSGVKDRLRRLRDRGDVRACVALINPKTLGYNACAFVQAAVTGQKNERSMVQSLLKLPQAEECYRVSGEFPWLIKLWAEDVPHLERLIEKQIRLHPGVLRVLALVVFSSAREHVTGLSARA